VRTRASSKENEGTCPVQIKMWEGRRSSGSPRNFAKKPSTAFTACLLQHERHEIVKLTIKPTMATIIAAC
jgi:hypothetical protein